MKRETKETVVCVLCKRKIQGIHDENNPWPLSSDGRCCSGCNWSLVIPARLFGQAGGDKS
tara:strand:- start:692 stop:871 length:180 start_codon:yes stop_codon:yes gene_type:complete